MQKEMILLMTLAIMMVACTAEEQLAPLPSINTTITTIEREAVFDQVEQAQVVEEAKKSEPFDYTQDLQEQQTEQVVTETAEATNQSFEDLLAAEETQKKAEELQNPTFNVQPGPPNPEIHQVRIFTGSGRELFPDSEGVYEIPSRIVNMIAVRADNKHNPFQLRIKSPEVTFQRKSFSLNLRLYGDYDGIKSKYAESNNIYYLEIDEPLEDALYPYMFITDDFASTEKHHFFISVVDADRRSLRDEVDVVYRLV